MKKEYLPIPVKEAARIASRYQKSVVIIHAWDPVHGLMHTTTYGVSPSDKYYAAEGGDLSASILGANTSRKKVYEDFRTK